MRTRTVLLLFALAVTGAISFRPAKNTPPPDLRDAPADLTDIKAADVKAGGDGNIPSPAAPVNDFRINEGRNAYARITVDEQIPAKIAEAVKASLNALAGKITVLSPEISIEFIYHRYNPNVPMVMLISPFGKKAIFLYEAKQLRYEWAPALKKPFLFLGKNVHADTMNIREQVDAVLDCAAFLNEKIIGNK